MFRILLVVLVLLISFDAVVHQGMYTRSIWTSLVGLTDSAVSGAKELGREVRDDTGTRQ
jgi:hypothetical protein